MDLKNISYIEHRHVYKQFKESFSLSTFTFTFNFQLSLSTFLKPLSFFRLRKRKIWARKENLDQVSLSTWKCIPAPRPKTGSFDVIDVLEVLVVLEVLDHKVCVHPQEGRTGWNCDQKDNLLMLPWLQVSSKGSGQKLKREIYDQTD